MSLRRYALLLALAALPGLPSVAQDRTLHWRALDVVARVEADGGLRASERHTMVFDGAWNGGERSFRLGPGQDLELLGVTRIDPDTGERREVLPGDLGSVDRYAWGTATSSDGGAASPTTRPSTTRPSRTCSTIG